MIRSATPVRDGSNRICQNTEFAPRNARFTPASRAAAAASYICLDQYSSCGSERNPRKLNSRAPFSCVSRFVEYVTSYPDFSNQRKVLSSESQINFPAPSSEYGRSNETFTALTVPAIVFGPKLLIS